MDRNGAQPRVYKVGADGLIHVVPVTTGLETDQLVEVRLVLQEDATFSNGLWTLPEVLGYFNQRQYRFLFETKILAARTAVNWTPGESQQPLPDDWIATIAAAWHDFATGQHTPLPKGDLFQMDHLLSPEQAVTVGYPQAYQEMDVTGTLTVGVQPAPSGAGRMDLLYVPLSEILDGTGRIFDVPDELVPYIKYGVYADMLGKDGRGQDLTRARYAEQRYEEGVTLAKALLEGY